MEIIKILIIIYLSVGVFSAGKEYESNNLYREKWYVKMFVVGIWSTSFPLVWLSNVVGILVKRIIKNLKHLKND